MRRVLVLCALAALPSAVLARDYEWNWRLPPEVYRNLEFTCRASVDRATKVFAESYDALRRGTPVPELVPRFRAAAAEWKKVQIQAEAEGFDEQLLAYVIFMQGFARQCAHDRNEAIKLFGEVLDLYPDEKWIARPARYWLGTSKVGMGDVRAGDADIDELLAEAGERPDPIVACALNDRARRLWADGKEKPAIDYLKRVDETFKETNHWTWESANDFLGFAAAVAMDFPTMEAAVLRRVDEKDEKKVLDAKILALNRHLDWCVNGLRKYRGNPLEYFNTRYPKESERKAKLAAFVKGMGDWAQGLKPLFAEAGRPLEADVLAFRARIMGLSAPEAAKASEPIRAALGKLADPKLQGRLGRSAANTLGFVGAYDAGRAMADVIKDPVEANFARYDVEYLAGNWKAAAFALEEIVPRLAEDPGRQRDTRYTLGWVYRDQLRDYESAIRVYREIDNPPRQLWEISSAYRGAKRMKEAKAALGELVGMYPREAAAAVYRMGEWAEQDGDRKGAIAFYRRILSQPEWKKSDAASRAHQSLERLGVATGGAMLNEVR